MPLGMDRESYLERVGEDVEPGGREPAPSPLRVVQKFVNSHNHEFPDQRDRLGTTTKAQRWLITNRLIGSSVRLDEIHLERIKQVREAIRGLAGDERPGIDIEVPLRVQIGHSGLSLQPSGEGPDRALGALLAIVHDAMVDGSWGRMKLCRQCNWMFYDQSRNRSGGWCSMAVCGNRTKNRTYRRRTATDQVAPR